MCDLLTRHELIKEEGRPKGAPDLDRYDVRDDMLIHYILAESILILSQVFRKQNGSQLE